MEFEEFFERAIKHKSKTFKPFPYQKRIAETGFPEVICLPTGAGKTLAILLAWIYRRRFASEDIRSATPSRLIYCLPMRVLVQQVRDECISVLTSLGLYQCENGPSNRIRVNVLMGGEDYGLWESFHDEDAIIIGTQDMLLSRALNRGYGIKRTRWPIDFGILNNDCLWVLDEVQLMGDGLVTSIQLDGLRSKIGTIGSCDTVWMSATVEPDWLVSPDRPLPPSPDKIFTLRDEDIIDEVKKRFEAKKTVEAISLQLKSAKKKDNEAYITNLSREIDHTYQLLRNNGNPSPRILVIVNTVERAQSLYAELSKIYGLEKTSETKSKKKRKVIEENRPKYIPELVLLHSRFINKDKDLKLSRVQQLTSQPNHAEGFHTSCVNDGVGWIIVSTQVVEAGVDLSSDALITELAPWTSIVQRLGRLNRNGECIDSLFRWIDVDTSDLKSGAFLPYDSVALDKAREVLKTLTDASPKSLFNLKAVDSYKPNHIIRKKDIYELFDTTPDLNGRDIDVSRFVRNTEDKDVQVFWWDFNDEDGPPKELIGVKSDSICTIPINKLREFLESGAVAWRWDYVEDEWTKIDSYRLVPGETYLISLKHGGYSGETGWTGREEDKPS
ncbi:MAG: DEAD/DEAH box helicase, partial [Methanomassiliicoccales archaeon]